MRSLYTRREQAKRALKDAAKAAAAHERRMARPYRSGASELLEAMSADGLYGLVLLPVMIPAIAFALAYDGLVGLPMHVVRELRRPGEQSRLNILCDVAAAELDRTEQAIQAARRATIPLPGTPSRKAKPFSRSDLTRMMRKTARRQRQEAAANTPHRFPPKASRLAAGL